jgi:predicted nucleic acid-binding protein
MGSMSRGLLDTSVVIALGEETGIEALLPGELAISSVTLAELHFGVLLAKDDFTRQYRLRRLGMVEATIQSLSIDPSVARAYGTVAHVVKAIGRQPRSRTMDLLIAATALAHNMPLYTRNAKDLEGLQSLIDVRIV